MSKQKKFILQESEIPTQWYNIQADMKNKPLPMLNPTTKKPMTVDELSQVFARECCKQELDTTHAWIDIPEEVRERYKYYRSTPLVRAYELEKALGTPAHIYFKNESVSPLGSHKINSALPQCYYAKQEGTTNVTTETGAGQWGAALSYAAKVFGLEAAVYQVKITMRQKPYRSAIMRTFGAAVTGSPSMSTRAGKDILTKDPNHQGSLGTAISEAVELARTTPNCKYALGSVMNHVTLHQTIIGLEAEKQMEMAGEYPDIVIGCFGGGSNFGGISFPFMRHNILEGKTTEFIAAEPASCPKLTRGIFQYDFGDEAGYTPLLPMFTLGHNFKPSNIHAGGLRYHGAGTIVSQLIKDNMMHGIDIPQLESFDAGMLFSRVVKTARVPESIITFRQGKSSVDASQLPNVERVASYMKKYADSKVVIKGYASPEGSVEVNARIAAARAEAVKTILVNKYKISASRITAEGQGVGDMFTEPDWNRVSICTIED